jgi:hypothetical protein
MLLQNGPKEKPNTILISAYTYNRTRTYSYFRSLAAIEAQAMGRKVPARSQESNSGTYPVHVQNPKLYHSDNYYSRVLEPEV